MVRAITRAPVNKPVRAFENHSSEKSSSSRFLFPFFMARFNEANMSTCKYFKSHADVIKWKHFPRYWPCARGNHRSPVKSTHNGRWRGALMFSLICAWINGSVNNRKAGDLRRHRVHYDATVMRNVNYPEGMVKGIQQPVSPNKGPVKRKTFQCHHLFIQNTTFVRVQWFILHTLLLVIKNSNLIREFFHDDCVKRLSYKIGDMEWIHQVDVLQGKCFSHYKPYVRGLYGSFMDPQRAKYVDFDDFFLC